MLLVLSDSQVIKDMAVQYCLLSFTTHATILLILYWSEFYLSVGRREYLNILAVFMIIEIVKWIHHKMFLEKDIRITYKKKPLNFFSLFIKCFDFFHLVKAIIVTFLGAFTYYFAAILFGAEVFNKYEQTFMFSIHLSVLTVLPMYINFGYNALVQIASGTKPTNTLQLVLHRCIQGTILGAWSGAFVIPLDWGRPWQIWPIPNTFCSLFTCTVSYLLVYCHIFLIPNHISTIFKKK